MATHAGALDTFQRVRQIATWTILFAPIVTALLTRAVLYSHEQRRVDLWKRYRAWTDFILCLTVSCWWVLWVLRSSEIVSTLAPSGLLAEPVLFWLAPIVILGAYLIICHAVDRTLFKLRWTARQLLWRAWWRVVSLVIPLLMLASGFNAIFDGHLVGLLWILAAGFVAKIGTALLRLADGLKLNVLKSGETRNRAFTLANRMGVQLDRVFLVPAGKGHLTNAYGISNAIGLTDNLGKYLSKAEMDFVIAHELAHVKLRHGRNYVLLLVAIFASMAILFYKSSSWIPSVQPLLQFLVVLFPLIALKYVSRQHEYAADREAMDFTSDPEAALRALINLNQIHAAPVHCDALTESVMTHPSVAHRLSRMSDIGHIRSERLVDILSASCRSQSRM
jgi:Zn-dependent protease with chaperone function